MSDFIKIDNNNGKLTQVSENTYLYAFEVLPPVYAKGCFGMGEIAKHTAKGEAMYYFFGKVENKALSITEFYGIVETKENAERIFQDAKQLAMIN